MDVKRIRELPAQGPRLFLREKQPLYFEHQAKPPQRYLVSRFLEPCINSITGSTRGTHITKNRTKPLAMIRVELGHGSHMPMGAKVKVRIGSFPTAERVWEGPSVRETDPVFPAVTKLIGCSLKVRPFTFSTKTRAERVSRKLPRGSYPKPKESHDKLRPILGTCNGCDYKGNSGCY